jgi:SAM-dependent methyltransferase
MDPHRPRCRVLVAAALALLGVAAPLRAQEPGTSTEALPAPLTEYMGRRIAPTMHWRGAEWLLRETRESEEHTARMLAALGVEPGDTVCDLGCGIGYLTLPLAGLVGAEGQVLAVDIQPEMLAGLRARLAESGVTNVRPVLGGLADPRLAPRSCDLVLMVDVYHELGYPEQVLAAVRRALKPDGRLVLVEFRAEDPEVPIKPEHKMSRKQVLRELGANGFRLESSFDQLPWQHLLGFVDADAPRQQPSAGEEDATGSPSGGQVPGGGGGSSWTCGWPPGWPSQRRSTYPNPTRTTQLIRVTRAARTN